MTLITKQGFCPGCMMSKKVLNSMHAKYTVRHLATEAEKNHVKDAGFMSYPICEPNDKLDKETWSGFQPAKLKKYAERK